MAILLNLGHGAGIPGTTPAFLTRPPTAITDAEKEEIKSAYRQLSKQYHSDTTALPLEIAAQKFMRLKDAYDTLSDVDLRNVYDSRLESKIGSSNAGSLCGYPSSSQQCYDAHPMRGRSAWTWIHFGVAICLSVDNPCQLGRLIYLFYSSAFV